MIFSVPTQPTLSGLPCRNSLNGLPLGLFRPYIPAYGLRRRLHKVRLQRFPGGFWTQRFTKLEGALLRAFGDLYAPSFEGVYGVISACC